jgi:hemerythrin-like domain-containing protein
MRRDASLIPLSHQHHNGLALCVLTDRSLAADTSQSNLRRLASRIVDRYELELVNHFQLEEELIFPPLNYLPLVAELIGQHRSMTAMVEQLRADATVELLTNFTSLLRVHIRNEENMLFNEAQEVLTREQLDSIGTQLQARAVQICL